MARFIILTALVSVALSYPDAPLYPNNVVFASAPLIQQSAQPSPQFITRINNGGYTLQTGSPNPALYVAAQPNAFPTTRVVNSPAAPAPASQGGLFQIVPEGTPTQSVPHNFVTFTRTPSLQVAQSADLQQSAPRNFVAFTRAPAQQIVQSADPQQSVPRNFVAFTRAPAQQVVQSADPQQSVPRNFVAFTSAPAQQVVQSADPQQSVPRNFVTFTRTPAQQFVQIPSRQQDLRTAQPNEQPRFAQQQFGLRNVLVPAPAEEATSAANSAAPRSGVRTVIVFPAQQRVQSTAQTDQGAKAATPQRAQPTRPRTVLVARPAQATEQPQQVSGNIQNQPSIVSSSQFFTRNFGGSGAVTYFVQPLSAPAGQAAPSNHISNAE